VRRLVVGGLAGIAVLIVGSLLVLDRLTRDEQPGRDRAAGEVPRGGAMPPAPVAPPGFDQAMSAARGLDGPTAADFDRMADKAPPRVAPPPDSWEAVPVISGRVRGKDPVAAALGRELADLHDTLTTCFDPAVAAQHGSATPTRTRDEVQEETDATVLVLHLEVQAGTVRVVDAPAASMGGASDATVACAQAILRGKVFEAPGGRAGGRKRLQYSLVP